MLYRESPSDWRGETNDVLHRLELIQQRDGALDFSPDSGLHNLLTHAFNAAQRMGMDYAVQVAQFRAQESDDPAVRAALFGLIGTLRGL